MEHTNKEIDLIELYQKAIKFIYRNFLTFFIFVLIGLLFGSAYYLKNSNRIKTIYLAETNFQPEKIVYSLSENVIFNLENKNYAILSSDLNIPDSILSKITYLSVDTSSQLLNIEIEALSQNAIMPFVKSLETFYNKQSYLVENQRNIIHKTQNLLFKVDEELKNIEEFQDHIINKDNNSNVVINQIENLHTEKIRLFEKKQRCLNILRKKKSVRLINADHNIVKSEISLVKILFISLIISFVLAIVYFFIRFSFALAKA